ncbi:hypothetical protein [Blautia sp.]|jgi:hypothetical protein|uniref:hypothetical protein n=1 Tax=Blautia sp. TaxID=1955243 RepID=UPI003D90BFC6
MNEKHKFVNWVKDHKKQLLIAGISVTAVIGIIIGLKNKEAIKELWENLENSLSKTTEKLPESITIVKTDPQVIEEVIPVRLYTSPQETFDVSQHIRNLSGGRHHSIEKAAEAAALGIDLLPHQTLVDTYTKFAA